MNGFEEADGAGAGLWGADGSPIPLPPADPELAVEQPSLSADAGGDEPAVVPFAPERLMRQPRSHSTSGWRLVLRRLSFGVVSPGLSAAERRQRDLVARVRTPIRGCRKVAFVSRKGGVGKTSSCLLVGHTFAAYRGDRVVALDGDSDAGSLAHRLRRETSQTVTSLLADADQIRRYADIRAFTSQAPTRLEVIAADDDPRITRSLGGSQIRRAIELLEHHYNLVCLDTAAGVLEPTTQAILDAADQVVVISGPSVDAARAASATIDWLQENGYQQLAQGAVAVVNAVRAQRGSVEVGQIEAHFAARCRACIRIPWDPHLETGAITTLEELQPPTRQAYLQLAAAVAQGFDEPTTRRTPPC